MKNVRETTVESFLYDRVQEYGGLCIKLNALWYVGIPDRMLLLPHGRVFFVETKTKDGIVSDMQQWWHTKLRVLGFRVAVLWTVEQAEGFLSRYAQT